MHRTKIMVDGVEVIITQDANHVSITRVVGRDRTKRPAKDITNGIEFDVKYLLGYGTIATTIASKIKGVARLKTCKCTCDYRYGYSDHAEGCKSIYVAEDSFCSFDDD